MLISLNWIKEYVPNISISDAELIKLIGARLVEVEGVDDQTHKYDGIYVVEVKECEKIEGTHLSRCLVNDGGRAEKVERDENGLVQVMCGAPNVHQGMFAAWIAPGATVPASVHDEEPFVISKRRMLKKYDSYGMLAGIDELDLGDDHSGIMELDPAEVKAGEDFADVFNLRDLILDIENKSLTHRPDTFGVIGFAREVAGILGLPFKAPSWTKQDDSKLQAAKNLDLSIEIADEKLCPRYSAIALNLVKREKTPYFTKEMAMLACAGLRAVDPIVDASNFAMIDSGQPTHTFDLDKFIAVGSGKSVEEVRKMDKKSAKIGVRAAKKGEKLTLLDESEVELSENDIVITSNNKAVALAGAMGGLETAIDENTQSVLLESATFSLFNLRKTQMEHGIFTEAITRFTKGQPASQTMTVARNVVERMGDRVKLLGAYDSQKEASAPIVVSLKLSQINQLLGRVFTAEQVKTTLENVGFVVKLCQQGEETLIEATVPAWRTDIHIPEDIIEEVGRLNGYDDIQPVLPLHATAEASKLYALKTRIREALSSYGANEVLSYSFIHGDVIKKSGEDCENSYRIVNSISPDLQYIRQSIVPSLLDKSYANLRAGYSNFALFEMNQVFTKTAGLDEDKVPNNRHQLAFLYLDEAREACYYQAKHYLEQLVKRLGLKIELRAFTLEGDKRNAYYEALRSATIVSGETVLGYLGEIRADLIRGFKLPLGTAAFELDLEKLLALAGNTKHELNFSQYPYVSRDLTITLPIDAAYAPLEAKLRRLLEKRGLVYKLACSSIYHAENSETKNISFHIEFSDPQKTLTKQDIQDIMKSLENQK